MATRIAVCRCVTCGEEFEQKVYGGNVREAEFRKKLTEENDTECYSCYKERIEAERNEAAQSKGWPELTGTEKQVRWAVQIREEKIAYSLKSYGVWKKSRPEMYATAVAAVEYLATTKTSAAWWIDHRHSFDYAFDEVFNGMEEKETAK